MSPARYQDGERVSVRIEDDRVRLSCNVCTAEAALAADPTTLFLHDMETFLAQHSSCEAPVGPAARRQP